MPESNWNVIIGQIKKVIQNANSNPSEDIAYTTGALLIVLGNGDKWPTASTGESEFTFLL